MNVKRYFVKDMQEAMDKIRKELGSDAIVLSSKPVRKKGFKGLFSPHILEVMVAYDPPPVSKQERLVPKPSSSYNAPLPDAAAIAQQLAAQQYARQAAVPQTAAPQTEPTQTPQTATQPVPQPAPSQMAHSPAGLAAQAAPPVYAITQEPVTAMPHAAAQYAASKKETVQTDAEKLEINKKLDELSTMIVGLNNRVTGIYKEKEAMSGESAALYEALISSEVTRDIATDLITQMQKLVEKSGKNPKDVLRELIIQTIGEPVPLKIKPFKRSVVLMLGATGVGKTTSLIKLAVYYQIKQNLKIGLINTDTFRVAANEQLKIYSDILGAQMSVIYSPEEITAALKEHEDKDLVFIDTAGRRPADQKYKDEIRSYIENGEIEDIFLVLSGSTGIKACKNIIDNYDYVKNYKIIVTKMDEAATSGIILNVCGISGRPISYIAAGQNVPNDIELADTLQIATDILGD